MVQRVYYLDLSFLSSNFISSLTLTVVNPLFFSHSISIFCCTLLSSGFSFLPPSLISLFIPAFSTTEGAGRQVRFLTLKLYISLQPAGEREQEHQHLLCNLKNTVWCSIVHLYFSGRVLQEFSSLFLYPSASSLSSAPLTRHFTNESLEWSLFCLTISPSRSWSHRTTLRATETAANPAFPDGEQPEQGFGGGSWEYIRQSL